MLAAGLRGSQAMLTFRKRNGLDEVGASKKVTLDATSIVFAAEKMNIKINEILTNVH